ncbi:WAT1-related protein [Dendrobium catenatum]|uniref:WAT1-related protein n=1 Tax=Dendrobium catenatum TaxID=906689 RepID=A0A2I0X2C6_9ASPA|nr:WAT1-related protein [Dendrobium catenatum]
MGSMERVKVPMSMLLVQTFTTGMMLLSKVVLSKGMFVFSLLAYRNAIGVLFVAPLAFSFESKIIFLININICCLIFLFYFYRVTLAMSLYYYGLKDTTAAYSSNFLNLIPIITFIIAVILGVERLRIRSSEGKIKLVGALLCVGGAVVFGVYKGKILHIWPSHQRGSFLLICSCFSYAFWFVTQVKLYKVYPSKYWGTVWTCFVGSLQTAMLGIIMNRRKEAWRLKWDLQLLTIIYSGILNTGATFCLISWAVSQRGPTYPPMFNPLSVVFTTILESFLFGQQISIGSLLGMTMIFGGLYAFLWAKRKEILMKGKTSEGDGSVAVLPVSDKD